MRLEVRKSGENVHVCEACGSYDLISVHELPLAADLTEAVEREVLRRQVGLARVFRDRVKELDDEKRAAERAAAASLDELRAEVAGVFDGLTDDVSRWRIFRHRAETRWASRVEAAAAELLDRTRYPIAGSSDRDRS